MSKILLLFIVVLLLQVSISAEVKFAGQNENQQERTIQSLLLGINSDNFGLKSSCTYMLGELKISHAVIPLMKLLKDNNNAELKIAAALALYKIGDERGIYAIKKSIQFEKDERVRKICDLFYRSFIGKKILNTEVISVK